MMRTVNPGLCSSTCSVLRYYLHHIPVYGDEHISEGRVLSTKLQRQQLLRTVHIGPHGDPDIYLPKLRLWWEVFGALCLCDLLMKSPTVASVTWDCSTEDRTGPKHILYLQIIHKKYIYWGIAPLDCLWIVEQDQMQLTAIKISLLLKMWFTTLTALRFSNVTLFIKCFNTGHLILLLPLLLLQLFLKLLHGKTVKSWSVTNDWSWYFTLIWIILICQVKISVSVFCVLYN